MTSPVDYNEVITGINLIWNNKYEEAEDLFEKKKDVHPRYALHYAEAIFLRSFITADTEDTAAASSRLKAAKVIAEHHIKALEKGLDPNDNSKITDSKELLNRILDARICYGEALYSTAILQMTKDAKLKGAFNLRKSWKIFEKALKESKHRKEEIHVELNKSLQFGAGFFLFAISIIPAKFLKLVQLAGFKADRDAGLYFIKECHNNGGIRGPYSTMTLLFNNLLLPRGLSDASVYLQEAESLINESLKKYPNGSFFHVMGSHCARKQCDIEKGIKLMEVALENSRHFKHPPLIYRYELANCYCMKLEWQRAADLYLPLVDEARFQVRLFCCLQLGYCYMMMNQKDKAMAAFQKALNSSSGSRKSHFDPVVLRQIKRYVANGAHFAAFELLYIRRDLAKMTPIMSKVMAELDNAASKTKAQNPYVPQVAEKKASKGLSFGSFKQIANNTINTLKKKEVIDYAADDRASYLLLKGTMLKAIGKQEEAIELFNELISIQDHLHEKLYLPYCYYEIGELYYAKGQNKEATEMMKKCAKISGYDWEDPLKIRLKVTLDQLKKGTLPPSEQSQIMSIDAMIGSNSGDEDKDLVEPNSDDELDDSSLEEKQIKEVDELEI